MVSARPGDPARSFTVPATKLQPAPAATATVSQSHALVGAEPARSPRCCRRVHVTAPLTPRRMTIGLEQAWLRPSSYCPQDSETRARSLRGPGRTTLRLPGALAARDGSSHAAHGGRCRGDSSGPATRSDVSCRGSFIN